jgi:hypothetical protein
MSRTKNKLNAMIPEMQFAAEELQKKLDLTPPLNYSSNDGQELFTELEDGAAEFRPDVDKISKATEETLKDLGLYPGQEPPQEEEPQQEEVEAKSKKGKKKNPRKEVEDCTNLQELRGVARSFKVFKPMRGYLMKYKDAWEMKKQMYKLIDEEEERKRREKEEKERKARMNQQALIAPKFIEVIRNLDQPTTKPKITNETYKLLEGISKSNVTRYVSNYLTLSYHLGLVTYNKETKRYDSTDELIEITSFYDVDSGDSESDVADSETSEESENE